METAAGAKGESQNQTLQNRVRDAFRRGLQWKWDRESGSPLSGSEPRDASRHGASSLGNETAGSSSQKHWPQFAPVAIQKFRRLFSSDNSFNHAFPEQGVNISANVNSEAALCTSSLDSHVEERSTTDMVKMKTQDKKDGEGTLDPDGKSTPADTSVLLPVPSDSTSYQESISETPENQLLDGVSSLLPAPPQKENENTKSTLSATQSSVRKTKASDEKHLLSCNTICNNESIDCDVDKNELLIVAPEAFSETNDANESLNTILKKTDALSCSENDIAISSNEAACQKVTSAKLLLSDVVTPSRKGSTNPSIVLSTTDIGKTSDHHSRKLLEPIYLNIESSNGPEMHSRKSPVTVQEWVDSIPLAPHMEEDTEHVHDVELSGNTKEPQDDGDVCPSVTVRPASGQSVAAADLKREAFSRDVSPSLQSDTGSHGSSVDSYLEARRPDPEEVLIGLGFGGPLRNAEAEVSRIPARFLQPSKVKGVAIDDFLRYQQDLIETFESGYSGYRGLTGGAQVPSVIVAKIMEKLREHDRESSVKSSAGSSPGQNAEVPKRRFSRAAQKVTILTKMKSRDSIASGLQAHSVLNPDNRKFLDNQGSKSPEVLRKRMIIGHRSFTFDGEGHLIETETSAEETNAAEIATPLKTSLPRPLVHKDSVLSSATSLSLTSYDSDSDTDEASGGGRNGSETSNANQGGFHCLLSGALHPRPNSTMNNPEGSNLVSRRLSLPSTSDLPLNTVASPSASNQVISERNGALNNKKEAEMFSSSTPIRGHNLRDLQRVNSAPAISPVRESSALSFLQTHTEENSCPDALPDMNNSSQWKLKNMPQKLLRVCATPKTLVKADCEQIPSREISNYKISDFTLPDDGSSPLSSPESPSSLSAEHRNLQRLFSMPKSSAMFLDKELRRQLSLNSSIDSYVARSVANTPDLKNWSTSSVSSWESEKEHSANVCQGEEADEDQNVFEENNALRTSKLSKSDSNASISRRRGSLKRQQKVDEEDSSEGNTSQCKLQLDISSMAADKGDSFEMEELAAEEDVQGVRSGSAHSDSSGFQEDHNHNKEIPPRVTLMKQLSESEPMLNTQFFSDENTVSNSVEHLKRLSLPVIRVQDESGLTQWRASSICGGNFSFQSSMRRVQSLPSQISRLGMGKFSESFSPGSISDSIGNMFSSCSDESVIHVPRKSLDVTCESDAADLSSLPAAVLDEVEVEPLRTPRECSKCNCALKKSLTKCHNDLLLTKEFGESFVDIRQNLDLLKDAQNRIKDAMHQVHNNLCSCTECSLNTVLEQVSAVIQHQNSLCEQLERLDLDLSAVVKNSPSQKVYDYDSSCSSKKIEVTSEDNVPSYQHFPENCALLCQVIERENRKLQDLVRSNVDELAQVRILLERLFPDLKTRLCQ